MTKNLKKENDVLENTLYIEEKYYKAFISPKKIIIHNISLPSASRFVPGLRHIGSVPKKELENNVWVSYKKFRELGFNVLRPEESTEDSTYFVTSEGIKGVIPHIKQEGIDDFARNKLIKFLDFYLGIVREQQVYKPDFTLNYMGFMNENVVLANTPVILKSIPFEKGFANSNLFFIYDAFSKLNYENALEASDILLSQLNFFEARKMQKENSSFLCDFVLRFNSNYTKSFVKHRDVVNEFIKQKFNY